MRRLTDYFAGALSGMLVALVICAAIAPDAWTVAPTPRSSPQADLGPAAPRMTTEGVSPLPSPDSGARTGLPDQRPAPTASSTATPTPTPRVTARPAPVTPRAVTTRHSARGTATWFRSPQNVSAAGPRLRAAIGQDWRGTRVRVCANGQCAGTILGDWMRADKLIDLDDGIFRAVCGPLSKGVCNVVVRW